MHSFIVLLWVLMTQSNPNFSHKASQSRVIIAIEVALDLEGLHTTHIRKKSGQNIDVSPFNVLERNPRIPPFGGKIAPLAQG